MNQKRGSPEQVVARTKAYPFPVELKSEAKSFSLQVVKLSEQGFLAEASEVTAFLQPGEKFNCSFSLPVLNHRLDESIMIIKVYSQLNHRPGNQSQGQSPLVGMIEAHFQSLSTAGRGHIVSFLRALAKQKK